MVQMKIVLMRRQEDAGQQPLDNRILAVRAASFVSHMDSLGVPPEKYSEVYELALSIYNDSPIKGPFGVDFMIQAAKRLQEAAKPFVIYKRPDNAVLTSCTNCQGSKISYKRAGKNIIGINRNPDGTVKKCEECSQ